MSLENTLFDVRQFFASQEYAGLVLPTGWFGRPYDNLLQLTRSEVVGERLVLELDIEQVLTFIGPTTARPSEGGILLSGFHILTWDWTEHGSIEAHHEQYEDGEVEFVAPIG